MPDYTQADREAALLLAAGADRMMQPEPKHVGALVEMSKEGPRRRKQPPNFIEHWEKRDPEDPFMDDRKFNKWGEEI